MCSHNTFSLPQESVRFKIFEMCYFEEDFFKGKKFGESLNFIPNRTHHTIMNQTSQKVVYVAPTIDGTIIADICNFQKTEFIKNKPLCNYIFNNVLNVFKNV
jgi:hypothetical protein